MKRNFKLTKAAILALLLAGGPLVGCSSDNDVTGPGNDNEPPPGADVIDDGWSSEGTHSEDKRRPEQPDTSFDDQQ
jgi:hypothetical protein